MKPADLGPDFFFHQEKDITFTISRASFENSMKSDKLISGEASWSGSRLFFTKSKI